MATIRKLKRVNLEIDSKHSEAKCTYAIVDDAEGNKYLQIDTYGSVSKKIPGKKSQAIRFSHEAIEQLKSILTNKF